MKMIPKKYRVGTFYWRSMQKQRTIKTKLGEIFGKTKLCIIIFCLRDLSIRKVGFVLFAGVFQAT